MPTNEEIAYAAGIIDGEGCISIDVTQPAGGSIQILVDMNSKTIPEWLRSLFGGLIHRKSNDYGEQWRWRLNGKNCEPFLHQIKPFIKLKTGQVDVGLAFCGTIGSSKGGPGNRVNERTLYFRLKLGEALAELNARRKKLEQEVN